MSDLAACALASRSTHTAEWQAVLPRRTAEEKSKERYISRFLSNPLIDPIAVMGGFIPELAEMAGSNGKTIVLPMDQSKISDGFECHRTVLGGLHRHAARNHQIYPKKEERSLKSFFKAGLRYNA